MAKTAYRVRNWGEYNRALVSRGSLTFWFSPDLVKNWHYQTEIIKRGRQKYYADIVISTALTLRQLFRLSLRQTQGMMESLAQLLNQELRIPNYTTLCRRAQILTVDLKVTQTTEARHVLVDSTGIQIVGEGEWKKLQHGETRYQVWKKLHLAIDADTQIILSAKITDSVRADGNYLPSLLNAIKDPISIVCGDGAYDKKFCYYSIHAKGAKALIPPQHNACIQRNKYKKSLALLQRDKIIEFLGQGPERANRLKQWKQENNYHKRSLIETMMSRMKFIFGDKIKSRNSKNQRTDLLIRCQAMNRINTLGLPKSEAVC